jgi:putative glycosyltransferase (TIGR04372 family)
MNKVIAQVKAYATQEALVKIPLIPPAITFVVLMLIARLFVIVQIYKVHDWRLGHLILDTRMVHLKAEEWNRTHKKKRVIIYYFGAKKSSNDFYVQKLKESHFYIQKRLGFVIYYLASYLNFLVTTTDDNASDPDGLMIKKPLQISFNSQEIETGNKFLAQFGLKNEGKFVCLHVRDSAFLKEEVIGSKHKKHSTRNSDIRSYKDAAETLAELGYTVFRMGSAVNQALDSTHPRVIDYATNGMRTEFLDIFLGARCTFSVCTNSGWAMVPRIFGRPIIFVNSLPFLELHLITTEAVFYPKRIIDASNNQPLSLSSLIRSGAILQSHKNFFEENGLRLENLSSQDLVDAVIEMASRVEMRFQRSELDRHFHVNLIRELTSDPVIHYDLTEHPFRAEYASCFLEKHQNLFV